jgi:hypothetical protein
MHVPEQGAAAGSKQPKPCGQSAVVVQVKGAHGPPSVERGTQRPFSQRSVVRLQMRKQAPQLKLLDDTSVHEPVQHFWPAGHWPSVKQLPGGRRDSCAMALGADSDITTGIRVRFMDTLGEELDHAEYLVGDDHGTSESAMQTRADG